jgi:Astacin (Peptidase family M12A)
MKKTLCLILLLFLFLNIKIFAQQNKAYVKSKFLWQRQENAGNKIQISVCWDNPSPGNERTRQMVREVITNTWQRNSAIEFTYWGTADDQKKYDIHIFINDENPHTKGLGTEIKNKVHGMVLDFDFVKWIPIENGTHEDAMMRYDYFVKVIAVHEFGHALGFAHEQNRPDCVFVNCDAQPQGENGDWVITTCDAQSVMNYCNPRYNNDGFLSPGDVLAVHYLYGLPTDMANTYQGIKLVYNSSLIKITDPGSREISHKFNVYISGSQEDLAKIDHVLYYLDPNWFKNNQRQIIAKNKGSNFGIQLYVWRSVSVAAYVFLTDGSSEFFTEKAFVSELQFEQNMEVNLITSSSQKTEKGRFGNPTIAMNSFFRKSFEH